MLRSADEVTVPPRITLPYAASTSTPWALKVVSKRRERSIRLLIQRIVNAGPFCDLDSRLASGDRGIERPRRACQQRAMLRQADAMPRRPRLHQVTEIG